MFYTQHVTSTIQAVEMFESFNSPIFSLSVLCLSPSNISGILFNNRLVRDNIGIELRIQIKS